MGISGGVDSSVSAILLQEQGYDVIGITMELQEEKEQIKDAKKVCEQLKIPHYVVDYKKEFEKYVIKDFCKNYANCKTPNPCIECNKYFKFGAMWEMAKKLGADFIATGHYAKTEYSSKYKQLVLKKSDSVFKDQSYMLWSIKKDIIPKIIFPLGKYTSKEKIRKIAQEYNLLIADKPDSQDICFIPNGDYKTFLERYANFKNKRGNIVTRNGNVLGVHNGLYKYTIGQRKGLGVSYEVPLYVIDFNEEKNELIVGEENELYKNEIEVTDLNWLIENEPEDLTKIFVKTRYKANFAMATINKMENNKLKVIFDEPQKALTPGQSAVFYDGEIVLGGGKIMNGKIL